MLAIPIVIDAPIRSTRRSGVAGSPYINTPTKITPIGTDAAEIGTRMPTGTPLAIMRASKAIPREKATKHATVGPTFVNPSVDGIVASAKTWHIIDAMNVKTTVNESAEVIISPIIYNYLIFILR
jgi:hypothetical protein